MYTFIGGINIHVRQPFVNLRESLLITMYVQLTKRPFLGWHTFRSLMAMALGGRLSAA